MVDSGARYPPVGGLIKNLTAAAWEPLTKINELQPAMMVGELLALNGNAGFAARGQLVAQPYPQSVAKTVNEWVSKIPSDSWKILDEIFQTRRPMMVSEVLAKKERLSRPRLRSLANHPGSPRAG